MDDRLLLLVAAASVALDLLIGLAVIGAMVANNRIVETQKQISDSLRDISASQRQMSQAQREQAHVMQTMMTQVAVLDARAQNPNE